MSYKLENFTETDKQKLTLVLESKYNNQKIKIKSFVETKNSLYIPYQYGIANYGKCTFQDKSINYNFNFLKPLRDYQVSITSKVSEELEKESSCILSSPTGSGKTAMALFILSKLQKKTLIIVHKEFLMNQWIERISEFLGENSIGRIQGNVFEIQGKSIVIGMLQSIVSRDYSRKQFEDFGLVIYDEVHHLAAEVFSKSFFKIGLKRYSLGLSATPQRKDGLTHLLNWHLGEIIDLKMNNESMENKNCTIKIYNINHGSDIQEEYNRSGKLNMPAMITNLTENFKRNKLICEILNDLPKNRKVLVLSDRIFHLKTMFSMIKSDSKGMYIGKMKKEELEESNKCSFIFGSYSMCSEGYDCPDLDTLILMSPKSDIVQSLGRIFRKTHANPLIIDFCDDFSIFKIQGYKRRRTFKKLVPNCKINTENIFFEEQPKEEEMEFNEDSE